MNKPFEIKVSYPCAVVPSQIALGGHGAINLAVFTAILAHSGTSWASSETLAKEIGCNRKSVYGGIKYWQEYKGGDVEFITTKRKGETTVYEIIIHTMISTRTENGTGIPVPKTGRPKNGTVYSSNTSTSTRDINTKKFLTFSSQGTEKVVKTLLEDIRTNQGQKTVVEKKPVRTKKDRQAKKEDKENYIKNRDASFRDTDGTFNTSRYVDELLSDEKKHINVIGYYFRIKGLTFSGFRQANAEFNRSLRIASEVAGYSHERIDATVEWIESQKYIDEWSLLTIAKHISNPRFNDK